MRFAAELLLLICGWCCCRGAAAEHGMSPEVAEVCESYWAWRLQDMPEFATFVGLHDYDDRLDDLSLSAYSQRLYMARLFLLQVENLEGPLNGTTDRLNIKVLTDELQTFIDGYEYKSFYMPLSNKEGIHVNFPRLLSLMPLKTEANYNTMLARLEKLPLQAEQIIVLLKKGVEHGLVQHYSSMSNVTTSLDKFVVDEARDSPIFQEIFTTFPDAFSDDVITLIQRRAETTISQQVSPAYQRLRDYVAKEYETRDHIALTSLPDGENLYNEIIRFHAGTNMTPSEIHEIGLDEVTRIEGLMQEIIVSDLGYNLTVQEFSSMIREDPDNFYEDETALMDGFRHIVYNVTTPAVPMVFKNIPKAELEVVGDPFPGSGGAFYVAGSYDGSRPGEFHVSTYDLQTQPKYSMLTLSLHEGNPGHHLQVSHAIESANMLFRRVMHDRKYGTAPSRFPMRAYYLEGWALYAESLGFDMDLFGDPLERYGHYSAEIFRACRLVVDTGIHALGWSKQDAIDFMMDHTASTEAYIIGQIDRYIVWPGTALAYKMGELQLQQLREKSEQELGDLFDIMDFHDLILEAVGPMDVVEEEVDRWIEETLSLNRIE